VYHLNLLESEGYIKFQNDGIYKRYYPSDMRLPKQEFSLNDSQTQIMRIVSRSPGISQKNIASIMGISSAAVHFQVEELIHLGFIRKERRGMSVGYFIRISG
jgi:predicted transcriptional regulator